MKRTCMSWGRRHMRTTEEADDRRTVDLCDYHLLDFISWALPAVCTVLHAHCGAGEGRRLKRGGCGLAECVRGGVRRVVNRRIADRRPSRIVRLLATTTPPKDVPTDTLSDRTVSQAETAGASRRFRVPARRRRPVACSRPPQTPTRPYLSCAPAPATATK